MTPLGLCRAIYTFFNDFPIDCPSKTILSTNGSALSPSFILFPLTNTLPVSINFPVEVGVNKLKKTHSFDLGSELPPILVECKSHRWTKGNNVPSAKITVWNEAMYYFNCASKKYRKIFFVLRDERKSTGETLASYYIRNYKHLIPDGVEIWEFNDKTKRSEVVYG